MKTNLRITTTILVAVLALSNCTSPSSKGNDKDSLTNIEDVKQIEIINYEFPLPEVPMMVTDPQETALFLAKHFWDLFDFTDTSLISQPHITEQGFVDYVQILNHIPETNAYEALQIMLHKAKADTAMYSHIASLFEKYFYNPNSPYRNEELYIPIVENALKSGLLSERDRIIYGLQQEMILKNRLGSTATDFVYTLANGDKKNLHNLKSDYTILLFSNPDCSTCAAVTSEINNSTTLKNIFMLNSSTNKMLTVLSVNPDSNIEEWRSALPNMPQNNWVNAYDDGLQVTNKRLYDIKAIPTLYLMDKNKKIILKDTSLEEIENYFMEIR